jgi:hypothetical protein
MKSSNTLLTYRSDLHPCSYPMKFPYACPKLLNGLATCLDGNLTAAFTWLVSSSFDLCGSIDAHAKLVDISKPLAMSMSCLGKTAGIALITSRAICLLRPGSFAGRPFGMQPQKCCTLATFDSLSVIPRPFRITVLQWKCAKHGKSTQDFAPSLHGWVMVGRAGRSGHIAWWTIFLPPPTMQS